MKLIFFIVSFASVMIHLWNTPLLAQSDENNHLTRFDSLFQIAGHHWVTGNMGTRANQNVLQILAGLYPQGITHEQVDYDGKHKNSTDRWVVVKGSECNVFEFKRWEWGGVFGFINGVNIPDIKDFRFRLERAVGKVNLGE